MSVTRDSVSIVEVLTDPLLLGSHFNTPSWGSWLIVAAAIFGVQYGLTSDEQVFLEQCLGGRRLPTRQVREAWLVVGRRGGKSRIAAAVAVFLAAFRRYRLAAGECGLLMVIARDRRQARVVRRYIGGLLRSCPMLEALIASETAESISLTNGIDIEIHTSSFRAVRGYTVVGVVCDEIALCPTEDAAEPDTEILNALRPAMATIENALLLAISSPYARRGELWKNYERYFGIDRSDTLVLQAPTWRMNPPVPRESPAIVRAYQDDEAVADAEYGAQFRRDVERLLTQEAIAEVVINGRLELPRRWRVRHFAFTDPAGGSGGDSMTLAIAHPEGDTIILDVVREVRPPFSPDAAVSEFAEVLRQYDLSSVMGDRYAGEWPRERFAHYGIAYRLSDRTKSEIYKDTLPIINAKRCALLDHARLKSQLQNLERRTARGGRDSIDHAPGGHDDVANAVCGALVHASRADRYVFDASYFADVEGY